MTITSLITLAFTMLLLVSSPGPGVLATISRSITHGRKAAFLLILGMIIGDLIYLSFAILGLAAIASQFGEAFFLIRILGAMYLTFLGLKTWLRKPNPINSERKDSRISFIVGLVITLGNPKVIIFYLAILPTFIDLSSVGVNQFLMIFAVVTTVLVTVLTTYSYLAIKAKSLLSSHRAIKNYERVAGTVMIGAGMKIAAS